MPVRKDCSLIPPFPSDINRDYFGAWLSGFTDGEGSFILYLNNNAVPYAKFTIKLRRDDKNILRLIQSYFGCGTLCDTRNTGGRDYSANRCPCTVFNVYSIIDLVNVIIPHFNRFTLLAKKASDFRLFKKAVELIYTVHCRSQSGRGRGKGKTPKWTEQERSDYHDIQNSLREKREYRADLLPIKDSLPAC